MAEPQAPPPDDRFGLDRVVFFSDAVIAIAITLLVLEIKVPEIEPGLVAAELNARVLGQAANYLGFFTSFWVIGLYWTTHHRIFRYVQSYDYSLLILNLCVLFFIALMPFPTALLFRYPAQLITVVTYAGTIVAIGLATAALWRHAARGGLLAPGLSPRLVRAVTFSVLASPTAFLLSIVVAFFNAQWAMYSWLLVLLPVYLYSRHHFYREARLA